MKFLLSFAAIFLFFLVAIISGVIMYMRFSQGKYVFGKEIPEEKKTVVKYRYIYTVLALFGLGIYFGIFFDYSPFFPERPQQQAASQQQKAGLAYSDNYTLEHKDEVLQYVNLFVASRPSIQKYFDAIEWSEAILYNEFYNYPAEEYGWIKQIYLQIKIKDEGTNLPPEWMAERNVLHYYLGGGTNPGVYAQKIQSQYFADMPIDEGTDTFLSMPEMAGIDLIGE